MRAERWQKFLERTTLTLVGGGAGVVLYLALFPGFYYMTWIYVVVMLWGVVALGCLCLTLARLALARFSRATLPSSPTSGLGFVFGVLVLVSFLVGFKVPLRASFLLARPGLERALAESQDDLTQVGIVSYDFGLYQIGKAYRGCHKKDRVFFQLRDDTEAAIIYSRSGIDDLCYNAGSKGHLFGNWYWMKED